MKRPKNCLLFSYKTQSIRGRMQFMIPYLVEHYLVFPTSGSFHSIKKLEVSSKPGSWSNRKGSNRLKKTFAGLKIKNILRESFFFIPGFSVKPRFQMSNNSNSVSVLGAFLVCSKLRKKYQ